VSDAVLTERRDGVLLITLNRPEARNAINGAVSHGLLDAVTRLDDDPELRAGVLTGAGQGFCAGMDLKAFAKGEDIGPMTTFWRGSASPRSPSGCLPRAVACSGSRRGSVTARRWRWRSPVIPSPRKRRPGSGW
jgi:enoyl-CoA hydratase/carnithine racemase